MKWYWPIMCDNTVADPLVVASADLKGHSELSFESGAPIVGWDPTAWLRANSEEYDGDPDDVLQNHLGLPVYSRRLRMALEKAGVGGLQYLPVTVIRPNGAQIPGFAIVNVLNVVSALDTERSDYDVYPRDFFIPARRGAIARIRKAVLRKEALTDTTSSVSKSSRCRFT